MNNWKFQDDRIILSNEFGTLRLSGEQAYKLVEFGKDWYEKRKSALDELADTAQQPVPDENTPAHSEVLSVDLSVKSWDLLERHYKHDGYHEQNAKDYELGWEAAVAHYTQLELRQTPTGNKMMHAAETVDGDMHAEAIQALEQYWNSLRADDEIGPSECITRTLQYILDGNVPGYGYVEYFGDRIVYDDRTWYSTDDKLKREAEKLGKEVDFLSRKLQERDSELAKKQDIIASLNQQLKQKQYELDGTIWQYKQLMNRVVKANKLLEGDNTAQGAQ